MHGIDVVVVAIAGERPYHIAPHQHGHAELLFISHGRNDITCDGQQWRAGAGDLVTYRPGQEHQEHVHKGPYRYVCIRIAEYLLAEGIALPPVEQLPVVQPIPQNGPLWTAVQQLADESLAPDAWTPLVQQAWLRIFLAHLWRWLGGGNPPTCGRGWPNCYKST